ncbi:MAG: EAL domain-containing protein [Phycisphaeraceae bacterium]
MRVAFSDKRVQDRLRPKDMAASHGQVVDLSDQGMRLLSRRRLRGTLTIRLTGAYKQELKLRARVVWHRRLRAGEHVHGLRFEALTFDQRKQLNELIGMVGAGIAAPRADSLSVYGIGGLFAIQVGLLFAMGWVIWSRQNAWVEQTLPDLYRSLSAIPEFGALLLIAAGGCVLLGLLQRYTRGPIKRAKMAERAAYYAQPEQGARAHQAELDSMRRSQSVLNCILESSLGGVCVLEAVRDEAGTIDGFQVQLINPAGEALVGQSEQQLVGKTLEQALPGLVGHELYADLRRLVEDGQPVHKEYQVGGEGRWFLVAMVRLADGIAVTFLDHTASRKQREQLQHLAYHDELTGLPNRKALIEHVDSALQRTRRSDGPRSALLFLDFDRFKHVNDTLGHEAGDKLLIGIAERLRENLRASDSVGIGPCEHIPARLGGDEFVVLLDGITGAPDAVAVAQRLLKVFAQPHAIAGQDVVSTASIGIAINDGAYDCADDILRDADAAMYIAKQTGKGRYVLFDQDMQNQMLERLQLEQDLRHAVELDQLRLVYEPIVDLTTGRTAGFETLVRWQHPERGAVSPAEFIPLAEDLNLIGQIGEWILQRACAQLAEWRDRGAADLFLNVNLSRGQLYEPNLVDLFREQILTHGLDPGALRLELTETMVMNDLDFMAGKLAQLKKLGLGLALDDFGTGYSSLSVLHKLPFDTLKIDRAFLDDARDALAVGQTLRSSAIIRAITELAEHLRLDVIAEGIAEPEQVATLQALACRYAQGWHFSKPMDADAAFAMLQSPDAHADSIVGQLNASA